jgi:acyl-CoA thioester hydrolase
LADSTIKFEHPFRVGWSDLDGNAHMGNSSYLDYASNTRMLFFAKHGFTASRFASEKFGPVIVRDELVYRKELRLMDEFKVDLSRWRLAGWCAIPGKEHFPEYSG